MPSYVVTRVSELLNSKDKILKNSKILILGVAYKKDISDMRESPALDIIELLIEKNSDVSFYDPFVDNVVISDTNVTKELSVGNFKNYDMLLVLTPHTQFADINFEEFENIVFDTTGSKFIKSTERI